MEFEGKKYEYPPHEISIGHAEEEKEIKGRRGSSLPADVLWGSFVTHSFLPHGPWGRGTVGEIECVTNEPIRTSAAGYCSSRSGNFVSNYSRI